MPKNLKLSYSKASAFKDEAEGEIVTVIAQTGLVKHAMRMAPPRSFLCHFRVATQGERM